VKERAFKQQNGFVEQTIGGETILVPLVNSVAKMNEVITLNELGTFIYHLLEEKKTFSDLTEEILNSYDVNKTEAINDLNNFLSSALEKKIIFAIN